jgi:hypothetical protein
MLFKVACALVALVSTVSAQVSLLGTLSFDELTTNGEQWLPAGGISEEQINTVKTAFDNSFGEFLALNYVLEVDISAKKGVIGLDVSISPVSKEEAAMVRFGVNLAKDTVVAEINAGLAQQTTFKVGRCVDISFAGPNIEDLTAEQQKAAAAITNSVTGSIGWNGDGEYKNYVTTFNFVLSKLTGKDIFLADPAEGRRLLAGNGAFTQDGLTANQAAFTNSLLNSDGFDAKLEMEVDQCVLCPVATVDVATVGADASGDTFYVPKVYVPSGSIQSVLGENDFSFSLLLEEGADAFGVIVDNQNAFITPMIGAVVLILFLFYLWVLFPCFICCCCKGSCFRCCPGFCKNETGKFDYNLVVSVLCMTLTLAGMAMAASAAGIIQDAVEQFATSLQDFASLVTTVVDNIDLMRDQSTSFVNKYGNTPCESVRQLSDSLNVEIPELPIDSATLSQFDLVNESFATISDPFNTGILGVGIMLFVFGLFYLISSIRIKFKLFRSMDGCFTGLSVIFGGIIWLLMILALVLGIVGNLIAVVLAFLCVEDPLVMISSVFDPDTGIGNLMTCNGPPMQELQTVYDLQAQMYNMLINIDALRGIGESDPNCVNIIDYDDLTTEITDVISAAVETVDLLGCSTFNPLLFGLINTGMCTFMFEGFFQLYQAIFILVLAQVAAMHNYHHIVRRAAQFSNKVHPGKDTDEGVELANLAVHGDQDDTTFPN